MPRPSALLPPASARAPADDDRPVRALNEEDASPPQSASTELDLLTFVKAVKTGKFPGADAGMSIAGGAPGTNAVIESRGQWTVIVLTNFDPPTGEDLGVAIADALSR